MRSPCGMPGLMTTRSPSANAVDAFAEPRHDAGAVGAEDARLRNRRKTFPNPDVEVVQACGAQRDEDLTRPGLGIRHVLVAEDIGAAVLVDANRLHGAESFHDRRRAEPARCGARARRRRRDPRRSVRRHGGSHPGPTRSWPVRGHAVHDGEAGDLVSSRRALRRRPLGRRCGTLLRTRRSFDRARRGPPSAIHVARRVRDAA